MTMQPWTASRPEEKAGIPLRPNSPFYWMWNIKGWEFNQRTGEFLPVFATLVEMAGVNGVRETKRGPDSSHARVAMQDKGYIILDRDLGYLTRWKTTSGGWYYESIFASPKILGNRVIWKTDYKAYNDFRRGLLEKGIIPTPDPDVLEMMVEELQQRASRHTTDQHIPVMKEKREAIEAKIEAMKAAISQLTEGLS